MLSPRNAPSPSIHGAFRGERANCNGRIAAPLNSTLPEQSDSQQRASQFGPVIGRLRTLWQVAARRLALSREDADLSLGNVVGDFVIFVFP